MFLFGVYLCTALAGLNNFLSKTLEGGHSWPPGLCPATPPRVQGEWAGPDKDSGDGRMWVSQFILGQGSPCPSFWWEGG